MAYFFSFDTNTSNIYKTPIDKIRLMVDIAIINKKKCVKLYVSPSGWIFGIFSVNRTTKAMIPNKTEIVLVAKNIELETDSLV